MWHFNESATYDKFIECYDSNLYHFEKIIIYEK